MRGKEIGEAILLMKSKKKKKTRLRKGVEQREAQCVKLGQKDSWMLSSVAKN